jgi:hypothetical protein
VSWLRLYAISQKVAGSNTDEVIGFLSIDLILPAALGPEVYSASNRNEYQELNNFLGSKPWPARKADNLTAISEPIVKVMWDP